MNNLEGEHIDKTRSREEINALVKKLNDKYKEAQLDPAVVESDSRGRLVVSGGTPMTEIEFSEHVKMLHKTYSHVEGEPWYNK